MSSKSQLKLRHVADLSPAEQLGNSGRARRPFVEVALGCACLLGSVMGAFLARRPDPYAPIHGLPSAPFFLLWAVLLLASGAFAQRLAFKSSQPFFDRSRSAWDIPLLCGIILIAAALRVPYVRFGLPHFYHPDEGPKAEIVVRMLENGSFHPHYFLHPSLLLYLTRELSALFAWAGVQLDPVERSVFAGRTVSALAGVLSVGVTFSIGRRLFSGGCGLAAAFLLAVSPLHVTCSRYLKEDALCTFLILSSVLFLVRSLQDNRSRDFAAASLFAGCAAGAKYSGMLAAVPLLASPWLITLSVRPNTAQTVRVLKFLPLVPLGFLICCPYAVLDWKQFLANFMVERNHMATGHNGVAIDAWSQFWTYHYSRSLLPGMTLAPLAVSMLGLGALLYERSWRALVVPAAVMLFYLPAEWVHAKPPPQPERYVLPCVPFLAIAAGAFLERVTEIRRGLIALVIVAAVCVLPAARSVALARDLRQDTREQMRDWIAANLPPGTKILIEGAYSPQLTETALDRTIAKLERRPERFTRTALRRSGNEYLLINSFAYDRYLRQPKVNELMRKRVQRIFESFPVVVEFNAPSGSYGFHNPQIRLLRLAPAAETNSN
ncbi:MAG: glycosyltransferase family 39 protein [Bdellovibrionota bacterium]